MKKIISTVTLAIFALWLPATAQNDSTQLTSETPTAEVADAQNIDTTADNQNIDTQNVDTSRSTLNKLWDEANTAYINSDFTRSIDIYNRILDSGMSSVKLYYNLGNAYFKTNNIGKAILAYNRALRLAPGDEDIRYNLEVAESHTKDKIDVVPEFFMKSWVRAIGNTMGCTAWSILSLIALVAMLSLFLVYMLSQRLSLRKVGFYGTLVSLLILVAAFSFAANKRSELINRKGAIVMVQSVAVKSSPDNSATDLFVLHEGTKVNVTNTLDGWCELTIADGKKGWVVCSKIEKI